MKIILKNKKFYLKNSLNRIINLTENRKGVTLMELVVGMMVFTLLLSIASNAVVPILRVYNHANELAESNTLLDTLANQIIGDLSQATPPAENDSWKAYGAVDCKDENRIEFRTGLETVEYEVNSFYILEKDGEPVLDAIYYKNKGVIFKCEERKPGAYVLTVAILREVDGSMAVTREYAVRPFALSQ